MTLETAKEIIRDLHKYGEWEIQRAKGFLEGRASLEPVVRELVAAIRQHFLDLEEQYADPISCGLDTSEREEYHHLEKVLSRAQKELEGK